MNEYRRTSFPALRCVMGDWVYYVTFMTFQDASSWIKKTEEVHNNKQLSDMIQRELKEGKTVNAIASYLLNQKERFFNAIVVGVYEGAPNWRAIKIQDDRKDEVTLDSNSRESIGVLLLNGDEKLFAIDGQHRVQGIKLALEEDEALQQEEICVIFVAHRETKEGRTRTRRLFSTLNRHAKPVSKGEIIAIDEDDLYAIVTRRLVEEFPPLNKGYVDFGKTAPLHASDKTHLTSILTLYDIVHTVFIPEAGELTTTQKEELREAKVRRPSDSLINIVFQDQVNYWQLLQKYFPEYQDVFEAEPDRRLVSKYRHMDGGHLMFRPIGQRSFAFAVRTLRTRGRGLEESVEMLSSLPMDLNDIPWRYILWNPNKRNVNSKASYLVAESIFLGYFNEKPRKKINLLSEYQKVVGENAMLPFNVNSILYGAFSVEDITQKLPQNTRDIFKTLRDKIIDLHPDIQERANMLFTAYKMRTDFASIEPRQSKVTIILNATIDELDDPKGICRDMRGIKHRGVGSTQIVAINIEQIDDIMLLVRQSFEINS